MAKISSTVACILAAVWAAAALAGGAAPDPSSDCSPLIFNNMVDCMMFLSDGGDEDKPEQSCCSGLKTVLETNWNCVCVAVSGSATIGLGINMTKAEALPAACGLCAPSISSCYAKPPSTISPIHPPTAQPPAAEEPSLSPAAEAPSPSPSPHHHSAPAPAPEAPVPSQHHHHSADSPLSHAPAPSPSSGASTITSVVAVVSTLVFSFLALLA